MRNAYKVLAGKPKGRSELWRHRHKWEDDIKMDLTVNIMRMWTDSEDLGQGPVAGSCVHGESHDTCAGTGGCQQFDTKCRAFLH